MRNAVVDAVDGDEVVRLAQALISAPSENPGGTEDEVAALVSEMLDDLDGSPQIVRSEDGRPSVVARFGGGERPRLAWNGHLDTVPIGEPATWEHPPFGAQIVDGRLVGRGSADMKGPVASALAAVSALRRSGVELAGTLDLHLVADEELAGVHGTAVLLERGYLDQDAAIIGEPTELSLTLAERGGAWILATAAGKAAHGSTPHLGVSAITSMARFVLRLDEVLPDIEHPLVGRPSVNAAMIAGGSAPNVVADRCVVDIDRRLIPGEDAPGPVLEAFDRLAAAIRGERSEVDLGFELKMWMDAAEAPADSAIAEMCRDALRTETGQEPIDTGMTAITDARFYINDRSIPSVILGPGSLKVAHMADESVEIAELVMGARVYARVFAGFLGVT